LVQLHIAPQNPKTPSINNNLLMNFNSVSNW